MLDEYLLRRAQDGPEPTPEVGWSHKHLITRFKQQIGLPPRSAARLVRFDVVWRRLAAHAGQPARWDEIAADSGYADQAHLIRDFQQFTGASPTAFLAHPRPRPRRPRPREPRAAPSAPPNPHQS